MPVLCAFSNQKCSNYEDGAGDEVWYFEIAYVKETPSDETRNKNE